MDKFSLFMMVTLINLCRLTAFTVPVNDTVNQNNDQEVVVKASIDDNGNNEVLIPDKGTEEDFMAIKEAGEYSMLDKEIQEGAEVPTTLSISGLSLTAIKAFVAKRGLASFRGTGGGKYTLLEPEDAGWGYYRDWQFCPGSSWAIGYAQRVEPPQGRGDDTAMNSIELLCADVNGYIMGRIRSYDGIWGYWGNPAFCNGPKNFLRGVQFKIEPYQGKGDDTAANDVRFWCASGNMIRANNGGPWGTWRQATFCPPGSFICALSIRFEPDQSRGDDTAMNGAKFICCSL